MIRPSLLLPLGMPQLNWPVMRLHSPVSLGSRSSFGGISYPLCWECCLKSVSLWAEGRGALLKAWSALLLPPTNPQIALSPPAAPFSIGTSLSCMQWLLSWLLCSPNSCLTCTQWQCQGELSAHFHQPLQTQLKSYRGSCCTRTIYICRWDINSIFIQWCSLFNYIHCKTKQTGSKKTLLQNKAPDSNSLANLHSWLTNALLWKNTSLTRCWALRSAERTSQGRGMLYRIILKFFHCCCYCWDKKQQQHIGYNIYFLIIKISLKDKWPL